MYRFLVLPYANALPLVYYIPQICPRAELVYRTPRWSLETLLRGEVDAALIPIVDLFTHPELQMIPDLGICSDGNVTSVLLQCHRPLPDVGTIQFDPDSRTSNVLAQVLIRDHFGLSDCVTYTFDENGWAGRVCIGDRALCAEPARWTYDLSGEWKKMTGLPFVFAVWAFRRSGAHQEEVLRVLHLAKEIGCRSRAVLAKICSERLALAEHRCVDYLVNCIHYDLGPKEQEGINVFRELADDLLEPGTNCFIHGIPGRRKSRGMRVCERG